MNIPWREISKFLSGAFFVSAGVLFYLWLTGTPVPLYGSQIVIQPRVHGARSIVHGALFAVTFYFGFLRTKRSGT